MLHPSPPRLAERVFRVLFSNEIDETRLGDLEEVYHHIGVYEGYARAHRWYWMQVIRAFLPSLSQRLAWTFIMLRNYLHTTFRHLRRHTVYTAINVFGLSVALAVAVLAYLFIHSEMTYDRFHSEYDQIYRVGTAIYFGGLDTWENTPFPLAEELEATVPGIVQATRLTSLPDRLLRIGSQQLEADIYLVDASFFDLFSFPLVGGADPALINKPNALILSDAVRIRYFGTEDPVGQTLELSLQNGSSTPFTVAAVAKPIPENSSITFDFLISDAHYSTAFGEEALTEWFPKSRTATFFKTAPGANLAAIQTALNSISEAHGLDRFLAGHEVAEKLPVERLDQVHFSTWLTSILRPPSDPSYAYILGGVALLILLIAGINFMNLAVGMSASRAREVGMRKVLGAHRGQLMGQFWAEALVLTLLSLGIGVGLAAGLLPTFNTLAGKALTLRPYLTLETAGVLVGLALLLGLVAGSYPALVLSAFHPIAVLKGKLRLSSRSRFGQAIMVFQFAVSVFLIACTLVMARQLRHVSQLDLGYDANLLVLQDLPRGADQVLVDRYREALLQNPNILGVTGTRATLFGDEINSALMVEHEGERITLPASKIDEAFLEVMELPLVAGRNFSSDHPSDAREAVLVNEAFVRKFGLHDPVGQPLPFAVNADETKPIIIGIVKDYHFLSLHQQISPHLLFMRPDSDYRELITRIRGGDVAGTLAFLEQTWNALDSDMLFDYTFFDEVIAAQYRTEQNFRVISRYAAGLAILIACLGLFGLTALSVVRRTKEMGIRKVLGATGPRLLLLFNKEFVVLLLLSTLVAWPAAYYLMHAWLQGFAYRINLNATPFVTAALLVVGLAVITITLQALKAIRANPADTLRHE